jgi:hypothetical protein
MLSLPQDGAWFGSLQENQCGSVCEEVRSRIERISNERRCLKEGVGVADA